MKRFKFFTEDFLDEVQKQRAELFRQIEMPEQAFTPVDWTQAEKEVAKLFANRLTWLLYQGGRIDKTEYIFDSYIFSYHSSEISEL